jgi:hypothetical protein
MFQSSIMLIFGIMFFIFIILLTMRNIGTSLSIVTAIMSFLMFSFEFKRHMDCPNIVCPTASTAIPTVSNAFTKKNNDDDIIESGKMSIPIPETKEYEGSISNFIRNGDLVRKLYKTTVHHMMDEDPIVRPMDDVHYSESYNKGEQSSIVSTGYN